MYAPAIRHDRFDTDLGAWHQAVIADSDGSGPIRAVWYFEGRLVYPLERAFPAGGVEILVRLRGGLAEGRTDPEDRFLGAEVVGQTTRARLVEAPAPDTALLGVRLHPLGARALFGRGVHELTGHAGDLRDFPVLPLQRLVDLCAQARSVDELVRCAAQWARLPIGGDGAADPWVSRAALDLAATAGRSRVSDLADRYGVSRTRFTTWFRDEVGVTPKTFARLMRFQKALDLVKAGSDSLSEVALQCGFYDQSHFTSDFRSISGYPPGSFPTERFFPANTTYLAEPAPGSAGNETD